MAAERANRSLRSNTITMVLLQFVNYAIPFLQLPYLARVLGPEGFGAVALSISVIQLAAVATDYGFTLSATYRVASRQKKPAALGQLFSAVTFCKVAVALPTLLAICAVIWVKDDGASRAALMLALPVVFIQSLQASWLLQGLERFRLLVGYSIGAKTAYFLLVLFFVKRPADYLFVIAALACSSAALTALTFYATWKLGIRPMRVRWSYCVRIFADASQFFISRAAVAAYTLAGVALLGIVAAPSVVAAYAVAEQLYRAATGLVGAASQALYPYMVRERNYPLLLSVIKHAIALSILGAVALFLVADVAIELVFGLQYSSVVPPLRVFLVVFAVAAPSILLGYPYFGAAGDIGKANASVIWGGAVQVGSVFVVLASGNGTPSAMASCVLLSECVVLLLRVYWARAHHLRRNLATA